MIATSHIKNTDLGQRVSFWFAILSPALGIVVSFLALLFFCR